nr:MAG TPA: hypothetical protein [Bacteriophage sp.]
MSILDYENEVSISRKRGSGQDKPLPELSQDRLDNRHEASVLWQECAFGALWKLYL